MRRPLRMLSVAIAAAGLSAAGARPLPDAEWKAVPCVPADLPPEALFETVSPVDDFTAPALSWSALHGGQNAGAVLSRDPYVKRGGPASMRVDYSFTARTELEYVQLIRALDLPIPGIGVGFWMKHDGTAFPIRLRITDSSGETHQVDLLSLPRPGWQFVAGELGGPTTAWGGDGNHRLDYPCKFNGLCIDRPKKGYVGKGSLWLADVVCTRPRKLDRSLRIETQDARFGNVYAPGETAMLRAAGGRPGTIRWRAADFWGVEQARGEGTPERTDIRFTLPRPGYFLCTMDLMGPDGVLKDSQEFHVAAIPGRAVAAGSGFLGACTHFGQRNYPPESMDLMRRYGIVRFRDEIHWRACVPQKGRFAMPDYAEAYIARAAGLGMRPLIIVDYNNPLYDNDGFPNSPEAIEAFAFYAAELARATRGRVNELEVWNEWIGGCGMGGRPGDHGPEAYGRLLKGTYAAVKKQFPDLTVVGIGGEYGPKCPENVATMIATAGPASLDGFSIHPYRYPQSPEETDLVGEVARVADAAARAGAGRKAWITEIGYPTHRTPGGCDGRTQARLGVRTLALLQGMGIVQAVYWYDFKDDGLRREYNEHNFGIVHHQAYQCAPKPAAVAFSVFVRMTEGARCAGLARRGEVHAVSYRRADGRDVLVAWTTGPPAAAPLRGKPAEAVDLVGSPVPLDKPLLFSENPVYVVGEGIKLAEP